MYRSETAIVTGPESALCHGTVNAFGRIGMHVRRAARPTNIDSIAAALESFDALVTLPRRRRQFSGSTAVDEATGLTSDVEHLLQCVQPAIRRMFESGRGGRIVTVVPGDVEIGVLTRTLATELSDVGICVNSVVVGQGVRDLDAAELIAYLAGSSAADQLTGASYTVSGNSMTVRGAVASDSKRGERCLAKSVRSRLRALHPIEGN